VSKQKVSSVVFMCVILHNFFWNKSRCPKSLRYVWLVALNLVVPCHRGEIVFVSPKEQMLWKLFFDEK
jgi:hypothetical protein